MSGRVTMEKLRIAADALGLELDLTKDGIEFEVAQGHTVVAETCDEAWRELSDYGFGLEQLVHQLASNLVSELMHRPDEDLIVLCGWEKHETNRLIGLRYFLNTLALRLAHTGAQR